MDEAPFHKLCYNSSVTTKEINDHLNENSNDSALQVDTIHGMTPLHILTMNPHASADSIATLVDSRIEAVLSVTPPIVIVAQIQIIPSILAAIMKTKVIRPDKSKPQPSKNRTLH